MRKLNFVQTRQSPFQSQSLFCTNPRQFLCPFQQKADPKGTYIHYDTFYNYRILQAVCQAKNERFLFFPFFSRFSQSQPLFCPKYRKKYRNSPAPSFSVPDPTVIRRTGILLFYFTFSIPVSRKFFKKKSRKAFTLREMAQINFTAVP